MHLVDWHATILQLAHTSPASESLSISGKWTLTVQYLKLEIPGRAPPNDLDGESLWNSLMQDAPSPRSEPASAGLLAEVAEVWL